MAGLRSLTDNEIGTLEAAGCRAESWSGPFAAGSQSRRVAPARGGSGSGRLPGPLTASGTEQLGDDDEEDTAPHHLVKAPEKPKVFPSEALADLKLNDRNRLKGIYSKYEKLIAKLSKGGVFSLRQDAQEE